MLRYPPRTTFHPPPNRSRPCNPTQLLAVPFPLQHFQYPPSGSSRCNHHDMAGLAEEFPTLSTLQTGRVHANSRLPSSYCIPKKFSIPPNRDETLQPPTPDIHA